MKTLKIQWHHAVLLPIIAAVLLLNACALPQVIVLVTPRAIGVLQGERATVRLDVGEPTCRSETLPCVDLQLQVIDYTLVDLPVGVSYRFDPAFQSPDTPGLGFLAIEVADTPEGTYEIGVIASVQGQQIGMGSLQLNVLSDSASPASSAAVAVAAGENLSLALLDTHTLYAWGWNSRGQVGDSTRIRRPRPVNIPGFNPQAISTSSIHSLALLADGTVWAWGWNPYGQLGDGSTIDRDRPVQVQGMTNAVLVSAGRGHSLALAADGTAYAWGDNRKGRLGDGTSFSRTTPVAVTGLSDLIANSAGGVHSLALRANGTVWAWGSNDKGQLGSDVNEFSTTPKRVANLTDIVAISAGGAHSLALDADGMVWAWGSNLSGQLGDGTGLDRDLPVRVTGLSEVVAISAGREHSLALRADGTVWAWGRNFSGQLGYRGPGSNSPVQIDGLSDVSAIDAGRHHSLAIVCGQVFTWGENFSGLQFGNVSHSDIYSPVPVLGLGDASSCGRVALEINKAGTGKGSVIDAGAEIDCADDCNWLTTTFPTGTQIDLIASADDTSTFAGWRGDCQGNATPTTITLTADHRCIPVFNRDTLADSAYLLTVSTTAGGSVQSSGSTPLLNKDPIDCGEICNSVFAAGTNVILNAATLPGYQFSQWSGHCNGNTPTTTVLMDDHRICSADWRAYELAIQQSGAGTVSGDFGGECSVQSCLFEPEVGAVTLTAMPAAGWLFESWGGDCNGNDPSISLIMDADKSCSASYVDDPATFSLTLSVNGEGTVTSNPSGIDCGTLCNALFTAGSTILLNATPTDGAVWQSWGGDCDSLDGPSFQLVMDSDKQCQVSFAQPGQRKFPVAAFRFEPAAPSVGQIVSFDGRASYVFDPDTGTQVPNGILLYEWDFGDDGIFDISGTSGGLVDGRIVQRAFQAPGTYTVRLRVHGGDNGPDGFAPTDETTLDVTVAPENVPLQALSVGKTGSGIVESVPPGLLYCDETCSDSQSLFIEQDTVITLRARVAAPNQPFSGWSGDCTGTGAEIQISMDAARTCIANFTPPTGDVTLTVVLVGAGRVIGVEPSNSSIDCGAMCSESYPSGTQVVLIPAPEAAADFIGWSGCDQTIDNGCVIDMTSNRNATATFN